jgi:negative regulator of flagellin synthesis FlgM
MDQGTLGKIGNKVDRADTSRKVSSDVAAPDKLSGDPVAGADTVKLTSNAKLLEQLDKTLAGLPTVNSARVDEIKTAIENGDYQIDSEAIADAMIQMDRWLGE